MGSSWITSLATIKPGDVAVVDYTLRDAQGNPILTSNQQLYTQTCQSGFRYPVLQAVDHNCKPFLPIGDIPGAGIYTKYRLGYEPVCPVWKRYSAISTGIVGLKANGQKTISLESNKPMTQFWSANQLALNNMSLSSMEVGQLIALGVSDNPETASANSTSPSYVRIGEVTNKTPDGVTIDFSYPSVDVTIVSINQASS